ncbi:unnamed protein product [Symbiodinium sp. CCMP2592]|nr:unnamed protein product [Symbiodinium sp. CCMP2592]
MWTCIAWRRRGGRVVPRIREAPENEVNRIRTARWIGFRMSLCECQLGQSDTGFCPKCRLKTIRLADSKRVDSENIFGDLHPARDALLDCPLAASFHEYAGKGRGCAREHAVKFRLFTGCRTRACIIRLEQSAWQTRASRVGGITGYSLVAGPAAFTISPRRHLGTLRRCEITCGRQTVPRVRLEAAARSRHCQAARLLDIC